jgi:tetratricopeptide (TPR) repeat protein
VQTPPRWIQGAAIIVLTLLAYLPAITRAGFIWDDDYHVTRNFNLRSGEGLVNLWTRPGAVPQYYPLTHTTFWLEYHLWGLHPAGYHIVNILLHATSAVLLWTILLKLEIPGAWVAWVAAIIWALHPVNVESVAWITECKNVLSGVLYLASLLTYLPLALFAEDVPRPMWWKRYCLTLLLFILAILSKSVTASLPAAILLIIWWKRGRIEACDILPLLPMFAFGLGMGAVTATMERDTVGAWGPDWNFSKADRILIAGRAVWFYAWKLIAPYRLTFIYPRWNINPGSALQWLFPFAAIALIASAWALRDRIGRGVIVALLFFGGTLLPALGFINVYPMRYSFVADHFQYLASIGLIVLIVAAVARWLNRTAASIAAALVIVILSVLTFRQTLPYRDLRSLWLDTIAKNPDCWMARNNYVSLLLMDGNLPEAEKQLRLSLAANARNPEALRSLGELFEKQGRSTDAMEAYRVAIEVSGGDAIAQYKLGKLLLATGETSRGMFYLNRALEIYPAYAPAHDELARVLFAQGRTQQAIDELERALALDPDLTSAQYHLAAVLLEQGHTPDNDPRLRELMRKLPATQPTRPSSQPK